MYSGIITCDDILCLFVHARECATPTYPGDCLNECEKMAVRIHVLAVDCDIIAISA